ncbi:MAG TPA: M20/M25/M40 family metallo-hydrolase [Mycobacterium sp.]|nr:M20/M25/M40 family metallo-hydrolase [Mycobacterium sp.]
MLISTSGLMWSRIRLAFVGISVVLATAACGSGAVQPPPPVPPSPVPPSPTAPAPPRTPKATAPEGSSVQQLSGEVSDARAMKHLQALQKIADEHGGNRASGTAGYDASVDYVVGVLRRAGFKVSTPTYEADQDRRSSGPQRNVIAQTSTGDAGQVVMIGAHLDSVEDGPGIVDNGSGVATLLEIATQLGDDPSVQNAVRFAFFGGEENGAEGSRAYVEGLSAGNRKKIKLYLNVDMVASPNGGYFVQGGEGRDAETAGPPGSATIGRVLADQLTKTGVKTPEIIEFVGDDESAFIEAGIPVGGAENGDAERKTRQQAKAWGGQARVRYDRCYHDACDNIDNVNRDVLDHYMRALAGTVAHFATSTAELR